MLIKILNVLGIRKTRYQKTKREIIQRLKDHSPDEVEAWVDAKMENNEFQPLHAHRILFSLWKKSHIEKAIEHGEEAQKIEFSSEIEKILENRKIFFEKNKYSVGKLKAYYETHTVKETEAWIKKALLIKPDLKLQLYKAFFTLSKKQYPKIAIVYGEKAVLLGADNDFKKVVDTRKRWFEQKNSSVDIDLTDISIKEVKSIIDNLLTSSLEESLDYIREFELYDKNIAITLKTYLLRKINKEYFGETVDIGLEIIDNITDKALLKIIAARAYALKDYENALKFYNKYFSLTKDKTIIDRLVVSAVNLFAYQKIEKKEDFAKEVINDYFGFLSRKKKLTVKNKILFELFFNESDYKSAIGYGSKIVKEERNKLYAVKLAKAYFELGEITNAIEKSGLDLLVDKHKSLIELYRSYLHLEENGFSMPDKADGQGIVKKYHVETEQKVLYVLNNSLPYHSNGYATRAHGLLEGVKTFKTIHAITRLGYPHDLVKFREEEHVAKHQVETIDYYHLPSPDQWLNYMPLDEYLKSYGERLAEHIKKYDIKIIHSASNFVNGLAANYAAKKMGIKSIYEVRGLWEITRISRQPEWENSEHFEMIKRLETEAAEIADIVVTITYALKKELMIRGIDEDKISVLPNGINTQSFMPLEKDLILMKELGIDENEIIIGYIGSIVEYEGIDLLVEAIANLKEMQIGNFKFLLVGDGRYFDYIKERIVQLDIADLVIITGRIPHEEVENYYSLIDIAPLPRKALPVSEMVSPLKPFEAMAMGKIVLGSSVKAIAEIIDDGYNGMLFEKSNVKDLTDKLELLLKDAQLREQIGKNARAWVVKERNWSVLAQKLNDIYDSQ
jgi:glycosyltransferase involved in cell wall biosynthesis